MVSPCERLSYRKVNGKTWETTESDKYSCLYPFSITCLRTELQSRTISQRSRDINEATSRVLMTFNAVCCFSGILHARLRSWQLSKAKLSRSSRVEHCDRYTRRPNVKSSSLTTIIFAVVIVVSSFRIICYENNADLIIACIVAHSSSCPFLHPYESQGVLPMSAPLSATVCGRASIRDHIDWWWGFMIV